ncbi:DMT family transporter [Candidatus Pelagibacter sp.]|nr:DMT family transporter [Candidatus Pelagibacter sp.]
MPTSPSTLIHSCSLEYLTSLISLLLSHNFFYKMVIHKYLQDIFLGFLAGFFQIGLGFIFITTGARTTPSAMVGIIMLSESVLGPIWAFVFISERPSMYGLIGGAIILFAVLIQFYSLLSKNKKSISH